MQAAVSAAAHPYPGRAPIRRLNRVEYANAVRDLLALDIDVSRDLPQDNGQQSEGRVSDQLSKDILRRWRDRVGTDVAAIANPRR